MTSTLRQTKLFVPPLRSGLVARPRLIAQLDQAQNPGCRAVILAAPAGFGKTTLMTQWLETLNWTVSWLALDENDNLPDRFFRYLVAAFQNVAPTIEQAVSALIETPHLDVEEVITTLTNAGADASRSFVVVLDDYHQIHEQTIHQAMRMLLDALPPQARLVVLSREDPPLPLARLRARAQLVEIRPDALRFTAEEAAHFLNEVMHLDLPARQIEMHEARTEGWIAGLQLAALSMQTSADGEAFAAAFSGSQRYILDYLVEEVLDRQPEDVQAFLLRTSVLERLCAPLCDAVLGPDEATAIGAGSSSSFLDRIERSNLFLIPLDATRTWYRYHHLFADLLRTRLASTSSAILPDLHRRASLWLEAHDDPNAAFDHAVAARDFTRAADIVDRAIIAPWRAADLDFFRAIHQLPGAVLHARPSLCLHAAWTHVMTGRVDRVLELVQAAEHHLLPIQETRPQTLTPDDHSLIAFARVLRAYLDDFANRTPALDSRLEQAIEAVPVENVGMRNSIAVVLGSIHYMEADFPTAARYFRDAVERDRLANGTNATPVAVARWARMLIVQG
jgi:LuxR family maltose regulon positive regulatory protein